MATLELKLDLPDQLAREAREAGLLTTEAIEAMLRERLRQRSGAQLRAQWARLPAQELTDTEMSEIVSAVRAVRARERGARS